MAHLKHCKNLHQLNKSLNNLGDPQEQRVQQSDLILLKKMRQAAYCTWRIWKAKVFGTDTPCKNKHFKVYVKPFLLKDLKENTGADANHAGIRHN